VLHISPGSLLLHENVIILLLLYDNLQLQALHINQVCVLLLKVVSFATELAGYFVRLALIIHVILLVMREYLRIAQLAVNQLSLPVLKLTLRLVQLEFIVQELGLASIFVEGTLKLYVIQVVLVEPRLLSDEVFTTVGTCLVAFSPLRNARLAVGDLAAVAELEVPDQVDADGA
jgi:hypothetical protein